MTIFILLTLWCHGPLSPFLPAAYEPLLLFYGQLYPPFVVAIIGALASAGAEYLNYHMYRVILGNASVERRVMSNAASRAVSTLFGRCPFLAVWICAWSPLPGLGRAGPRFARAVFRAQVSRRGARGTNSQILVPGGGGHALGAVHRNDSGDRRELGDPDSGGGLPPSIYGPVPACGQQCGAARHCRDRHDPGRRPAIARCRPGDGCVAGSVRRPGPRPVAFTFRRSRLTGAGPAEDLAVRLFPEALSEGVALIGADVGAMQTVAWGPVGVFVKGGVSPIVRVGARSVEVLPGLEAGFGTLVRLQRRAAIRVDITRHWFYSDGERYGVWSFGFGLSVLPYAAGNRPR